MQQTKKPIQKLSILHKYQLKLKDNLELGLVLIKIFKSINHQILTSINRLISNNFCSQPETPWKLQNSSTCYLSCYLLYKQAVHLQSLQAFSQSCRKTSDVIFSGKRAAPILFTIQPDQLNMRKFVMLVTLCYRLWLPKFVRILIHQNIINQTIFNN